MVTLREAAARVRIEALRRVVGGLAVWGASLGVVACDPPEPAPDSILVGCEVASQRVRLTTSAHLDPECVYSGGFDIEASDVTLDCRQALIRGAPGTSDRGIAITAPPETVLENVRVRGCRVEGFLNSVRVSRTGFRQLGEGEEYTHTTREILLEENVFADSRGVGVYVDAYVSDVVVRRNVIMGAGSAGIYLETGSRRNHVDENLLIDNGYRENGPSGQPFSLGGVDLWFWGVGREGLAIDGSYENLVTGNVFQGNSAGGIFLYKNCGEFPTRPRYFERRHPADANRIEGNLFRGGRNGVWIGSRMAENTLPMSCTDPAYVDEPLRRVVLDHAAENVVRGNVFEDVRYGVRVEDDFADVVDNTFTGTGPDRHAVIVGTPERTDVLGWPVTGTTLHGNVSTIVGNRFPYRWIHGHADTTASVNLALGEEVGLCPGPAVPRQPFIFVIAAALAGPGGTAPNETPNLAVPILGALDGCGALAP